MESLDVNKQIGKFSKSKLSAIFVAIVFLFKFIDLSLGPKFKDYS